MSDQPTEPLGQEPGTTSEPPTESQQTFDADYVRGLRDEAASWRVKLREKEQELAQIQTQRKADEQAKLQEDEKWKELAEQRQQDLDELQAKVKAQEIQTLKMATINELGLPAEAMDFLTGEDVETIKAQAEKFQALTQARSQTNPRKATTPIPGGEAVDETREQRHTRLYGRSIFD